MAQIKASWPRVTVTTSRDGVPGEPQQVFLYEFVDGTRKLSRDWSDEYYLHVKNGTVPPPPALRIPDISNVVLGSKEYAQLLCQALGEGRTAQGIRAAFDRRGWQVHKNAAETKRIPSPIPGWPPNACRNFVLESTPKESSWIYAPIYFSNVRVPKLLESIQSATLREHRPSECRNRVPPEQVAACEAYVSSTRPDGSGGTIEDFIDRIRGGEMSQEEFDALTRAGGGKTGGLFGNIPKMYLAAGAVGVVLVVAVALKGRK